MKYLPVGTTDWPQLLADLRAKRDALAQVLAILTTQFGSESGAGVSANGASRQGRPRSRAPVKRARSVKRAPRRTPAAALDHPNRDQPRTEAVLKLLKDGSLSTKAIAAQLGQDRKILKMALQRLKKSGVLLQVGHGPGTKWMLPARPAKEAP